MTHHGFEGLESIASDAKHRTGIGRNLALSDELLGHTHGHTAGRLSEDSLRLGEQSDAFTDFIVRNIFTMSTSLLHDLEGIEAVGGGADGQRFGNGVRLHRLEEIQSGLLGSRDRRATRSLSAMNLPPVVLDQTQLGELLIALVDLRQQRTGGHTNHRVLGNLPPHLFLDLKAHALGSFGVVGPHVDIHESPTVFARDLRAQSVHLIVMPTNSDYIGPVHQ